MTMNDCRSSGAIVVVSCVMLTGVFVEFAIGLFHLMKIHPYGGTLWHFDTPDVIKMQK